MPSYEILRVTWWLLLGILLAGFAVMDGFDFGACALLPFVGKTDPEKRIILNAIGPTWEGNQVWLILGGGAIFAAWPLLYAVSFSGFYLAMLLVLLTLIIRPVGIKYRSKQPDSRWRTSWDMALCFNGIVAPLLFGVAVGNVIQGVPFTLDDTMRSFYSGSFWALLNPFALLCGLVSVSMLIMQGGYFLATKTHDPIRSRARTVAKIAGLVTIVLFALGGIWVANFIEGYQITSAINHGGYSDPLSKTVSLHIGAWLTNYHLYPITLLAPIMGFGGCLLAMLLTPFKESRFSLVASSLAIIGIVATVGVSMFPFLLPSSSTPNVSLTVWDASSSQLTLFIMLVATLIFMPIILAYTSWVYYKLRGKVDTDFLRNNTTVY